MGDYVKIYRAFSPKEYYVVAFNEFDYEYTWKSSRYRWLWRARGHGVAQARDFLARGVAQLGDFPVLGDLRPIKDKKEWFETVRTPEGRSTRIFIERIDL